MKIYENAPTKAIAATGARAPTNDPVALTIKPMASGVIMPDKLVAKLNSPPVIPINSFGAISEITVQPNPTIPWPKNATDRMTITIMSLAT